VEGTTSTLLQGLDRELKCFELLNDILKNGTNALGQKHDKINKKLICSKFGLQLLT
jgi:hypothetical protein